MEPSATLSFNVIPNFSDDVIETLNALDTGLTLYFNGRKAVVASTCRIAWECFLLVITCGIYTRHTSPLYVAKKVKHLMNDNTAAQAEVNKTLYFQINKMRINLPPKAPTAEIPTAGVTVKPKINPSWSIDIAMKAAMWVGQGIGRAQSLLS